eukprot:TRINITY_DN3206_c0_g1_i3.p1 TRINITY_DN3206_c0_g1~~TRINITY_DN3206_c0_g1_i3.p1  ORF type:complete len:163 (-),score=58.26 TRINITY_DN3206_c0_g1_i3:339-827(-)
MAMADHDGLDEPSGVEHVKVEMKPAGEQYEATMKYARERAEEETFSDTQLQEFEQMVLLSEDELKKAITAEEIENQQKRLEDLKALKSMMVEIHETVNNDTETQDAISKKCKQVIEHTYASKQDLKKAYEYKVALQKKKMWFCIILWVCLAIAGLVIYFLVK